jgi:glycolate oxidase iron-sulfur subunit
MQTRLPQSLLDTSVGREADDILRRCVHCGFCNATCPTFRLSGDELEGPRGRIYLVKSLLEGKTPTVRTLTHLDHCLGCRACEITCPSGVNFHRLADIGRERMVDIRLRPVWDRGRRKLMARIFDDSRLLRVGVSLGRILRGLLPGAVARQLPAAGVSAWPPTETGRHILLHEGCVQPTLGPSINGAAARVLHRRGIGSRPAAGCCGALAYHLDDLDRARVQIRRNIDTWSPALTTSEGLVVTASGCAAFLKDYGRLCQDDPDYKERGDKLSSLIRDAADFLEPVQHRSAEASPAVALHIPCTLKNALHGGLRLRQLLTDSGWRLVETADDGQCCGSAGAYSLLHRQTADRLRKDKLDQLESGAPERIVTANIGCRMHLASGTKVPVQHWIELWDELEAAHPTPPEKEADARDRKETVR